LVIGATRAPAFYDGIHAVAKRGQMTGGPGGSLDHDKFLVTNDKETGGEPGGCLQ
jgi:hypothetical protein